MGFSSGKSKAKRKAAKAAAAAYYKALRETQNVDDISSVKADTRRNLDDSLGDNLDGQTKRLARKADTLASQIRKKEESEPGLKDAVSKYKQRYDTLQKQLAGRTVTREEAGLPSIDVNGRIAQLRDEMNKPQGVGLMGQQNLTVGIMGQQNPSSGGMLASIDFNNKVDAIRKEAAPFQAIDGSYRQLNVLKDAYDDINSASAAINKSPSLKLREQYGQIAQQLQSRVKKIGRDAQTRPAATGLLSSELAQAGPYSEVIR